MDPVETAVIAAVAGEAGKALVVQTFTQARKILRRRFKDHDPEARTAMAENAADLIAQLAKRVQELEQAHMLREEQIAAVRTQPSVSILIEKAILSGAEAELPEARTLIADIVAERLRVGSETVAAMTSPLAVEAIAHMTSTQLRVLGFFYTVRHLKCPYPLRDLPPASRVQTVVDWALTVFKPYADLDFRELDLMHLEAIRCLGARDIGVGRHILSPSLMSDGLDVETWHEVAESIETAFQSTDLGHHVEEDLLIGKGLAGTSLNSTGSLIGMYVSNQLAGLPTDITSWIG